MCAKSRASRRKFLRLAVGAGVLTWPKLSAISATDQSTADDVPVSGIEHPALASFDKLMVDFVRYEHAVGAALAVTKDGRLVYARGFGLADRDQKEPVQPNSLFRIASLSKVVTAAAILQLAGHKKLALTDKVCQILDLRETMDERWPQVTIGQLLHHTGGWDRDKSFDPMFRSIKIAKEVGGQPPAMPADIIRYMTRQPLDFDPGERYAYSNFGYSLLGRVIERVSGADYGQVVRSKVLAPLGIRRMKLGVTLVGGRAEHEVRYYDAKNRTGKAVMGPVGEQVPLPYGAWCLEAMDAHGGWIASAVDMVRFAAAFDSPSRCRILSADGVGTMFERPADAAGHDAQGKPKDVYYACGWNVRRAGKDGRNTWHTGSLDGTSTLLVRRTDGLDWAVMFNCRDGAGGKQMAGAIDPLVHKAADAVADWPRVDHFNKWL